VYRTIMCYSPGQSIAYFSTPDILFQGVPTGLPAGDPQAADNARTIREMAAAIDLYRGVDVSMSSPVDGAVFTQGDTISLAARAYSEEGEIAKVEFMDDTRCLGHALQPYSILWWTNAAAGQHVLSARLTTVDGTVRTSAGISIGVRPVNDDFANRIELSGSNPVASGVLCTATAEQGEPSHFGPASRTAWWTWTAPASGLARIATSGFNRPRAAVYIGNELAELQLVAKTTNTNNEVWFQAMTGQPYQIVLEGSGLMVTASQIVSVALGFVPHPTLLPPQIISGKTIELVLTGTAGQKLQVQASTDLVNWKPLQQVQLPSSRSVFRDWLSQKVRFYRVVAVP
jgi:hypothetical protein